MRGGAVGGIFMLRKWNRMLAFLLALALVTTTFGSDIASTKVYAVGSEEEKRQNVRFHRQLHPDGERF